MRSVLATAGLGIALLAGCGDGGPELATVTGQVTDGGTPVPDASVEFIPQEGRLSVGETDAEGRYTLHYTVEKEGAVLGAHTVKISSGGTPTGAHDYAAGNRAAAVPEVLLEKEGVEVTSGENELDFDVSE